MVNGQFSLHGKVSLVTGASRGIGKTIAIALAKAGAAVAGTARPPNLDMVIKTKEVIEKLGQRAFVAPLDVGNVDEVSRLIDRVVENLGGLDILVNNAGTALVKHSINVTEEEWDSVMATNIKGMFFCCQTAARHMINNGGGKIINVSSQLGISALPYRAPYCASKGAVVNMTRSLALEWAQYKIYVNGLAPGPTKTDMLYEPVSVSKEDAAFPFRVPLGRLMEVEDIVGAALYLASSASDGMIGQTLVVDGGWTAM